MKKNDGVTFNEIILLKRNNINILHLFELLRNDLISNLDYSRTGGTYLLLFRDFDNRNNIEIALLLPSVGDRDWSIEINRIIRDP